MGPTVCTWMAAAMGVPVAVMAARSRQVRRWRARSAERLAIEPCPACGWPFGAGIGGRPFSLFDVLVTCPGCGASTTYTLGRGGPTAGVTLPRDADTPG